jgi:hypothetical protein
MIIHHSIESGGTAGFDSQKRRHSSASCRRSWLRARGPRVFPGAGPRVKKGQPAGWPIREILSFSCSKGSATPMWIL